MTTYLAMALVIILPPLIYKPIQSRSLIDGRFYAKRSTTENAHLFACFCFMLYLMAFRGDMSTDFKNYYYIWLDVQQIDSLKDFLNYTTVEYGYVLLNKVVSIFTDDYYVFLFICALIILIPIYGFAKFSPYAWLTLLLYISFGTYYQSFNVMRQMMAASIILVGFQYIYRGNFKKTVLFSVLASFLHGTALLFIPSYFLFRTNTRKMKWWQMVLLYSVLSISITSFYTMYMVYFKREAGYQLGQVKVYEFKNIAYSVVIFLACLVIHMLQKNNSVGSEKTVENITLVGVVLWIGFLLLSQDLSYMMRLAGYFSPFVMIALPNYISRMRLRGNQMVVTVGIVVFCLIVLMNGYGSTIWVGR